MNAKKRRLGRGLGSLIGDVQAVADAKDAAAEELAANGELQHLPLTAIHPGRFQPRTHFDDDALQELAESIRAQGVVQPIVVRSAGQDYELVAGERRWRAAQLAELAEIPAVVRELDDDAAAAIGLIENIQRENLNPLEQARAFQRLIREFELTHQQVADSVGRSRAAVSNLIRLLDLNADVSVLVEIRKLEMGHARALLGVEGEQQSRLANKVVSLGLSVRETEALVRSAASTSKKTKNQVVAVDPNIRRLEQDLAEKLGAKISISQQKNGKGKLVIQFNNNDELEGVLGHIQ